MADNYPIGFCQCGCGQPTNINKKNSTSHHLVKGQPRRFLAGHNTKLQKPRKRSLRALCVRREGRVVRHHRVRAEQALGRPLPPKAVIHHPDRDPWNPDARLVICDSQAYHMLLHRRMRIQAAGGNPNTDGRCSCCKQVKPIEEFYRRKTAVGRARIGTVMNTCKSCAKIRLARWHQNAYSSTRSQSR